MRDRPRVRAIAAGAAIVVCATFAAVGVSSTGALARTAPHRVNARPSWATPRNRLRSVAANRTVSFDVLLDWTDPTAVADLARAVSDPSSPSYGQYLSPSEFHARFSQPASAVAAVRAWLIQQGLKPGRAPASHLYVPATGTAQQIERAFGVRMNYYRAGRKVLRAPSADPLVPASLSGIVKGVVGLTGTRMRHSPMAPPPAAFKSGQPCSSYWGQKTALHKPAAYGQHRPFTPCGYAPNQVEGAYGLGDVYANGIDGTGVTVAVVDAYNAPTMRHDLVRYSRLHGLPAPLFKQHNVKPVPGNVEDKQGWYGEEALDLEAIHSMAPGAKLVYAGAKDSFDASILNRVAAIVDNHWASIINNSYGSVGEKGIPRSEIRAENAVYQQAIAEGIGVYFSSGDCGDELDPDGLCGGAGYRSADFPASSPWVTAVGGTSLAVGQDDGYLFETGWGTGLSPLSNGHWDPTPPGLYLYGAGGGPSRLFKQPWYQTGVVPASLSQPFNSQRRVVPDIAADGDPNTGFLVGETQTFPQGFVRYDEYRLGGTSLSSPLIAGIAALANQAAGHDLGFLNPALYALHGGSGALHDIVDPSSPVAVVRTNWVNGVNHWSGRSYSLRSMNDTGTLHTTAGYDDVTGLGTPNGWAFIRAMARA